MNKNFKIELCSDLDFEGMVIDICFDNKHIAMINYDKGIDNIEIELLPYGKSSGKIAFPLKEFFSALEKAKELAIKCAKEDELRADFNITE